MTLLDQSHALRRPSVLVRAARYAARDYRRERAHRQFLGQPEPVSARRALARLLRIECDLDEKRRAGMSDYAVGRHVMILAAVICETARLSTQSEGAGTPDRVPRAMCQA